MFAISKSIKQERLPEKTVFFLLGNDVFGFTNSKDILTIPLLN
jgi:hypothetical protein